MKLLAYSSGKATLFFDELFEVELEILKDEVELFLLVEEHFQEPNTIKMKSQLTQQCLDA